MSAVLVRMVQQMSGTRNGVPWPAVGETLLVDEDEAVQLCRRTASTLPIAERVEEAEPATTPAGPQQLEPSPQAKAKAAAQAKAAATREPTGAGTAGSAGTAAPGPKK